MGFCLPAGRPFPSIPLLQLKNPAGESPLNPLHACTPHRACGRFFRSPAPEIAPPERFLNGASIPLNNDQKEYPLLAQGVFLLAPSRGIPAELGQSRRQPGELKTHPPDGFLPACGQAVPFDSPTSLIHKESIHPEWDGWILGTQ